MRIFLIWPSNDDAVLSDSLSCCEPLPLEYLGGALKPNHDVVIHDLRFEKTFDLLLAQEEPQLIGLAIPYTVAIRSAYKIAREIKKLWPSVPLVIGGHHVTVSSEWLKDFPADYIIRGEGGPALNYLANRLEKKASVEALQGLSVFNEQQHNSLFQPLRSLEELPKPDRSLIKKYKARYFHSIYRPVALIRFSSGCLHRCSFCIAWKMTDQRYIIKSIPRILNELKEIDVHNVYVVDDEAFLDPLRTQLLAKEISLSKIIKRYHMYVRADTALKYPNVIAKWAEIGLDSVLIGAESMEDEELSKYKKGIKATQTSAAIKLFHSFGVKVRANFIIHPNFTKDDFVRLAQNVKDLEVDLPSFSILTPLPGTQLFHESKRSFISFNPDLFDCYHTLFRTKLPIVEFYREFAQLFKMTSQRTAISEGSKIRNEANMFYYSNEMAFSEMTNAIEHGYKLNTYREKEIMNGKAF